MAKATTGTSRVRVAKRKPAGEPAQEEMAVSTQPEVEDRPESAGFEPDPEGPIAPKRMRNTKRSSAATSTLRSCSG
jgi:hypothetical protein